MPTASTGHAAARNMRAAITALSSVGAKGLSGVTALVSIPLTLSYLGRERFGLWMTIASLQALFAFADFGLGNGLLTIVAEAYGRGDHELASRATRSALALQAVVAAVLLAAFFVVSSFIDWPRLLHVSGSIATLEARPATLIFATVFFVRSVVQVVQQAQYGLQMGYVANAWTAAGNIAALVGLYVCARNHAGVPVLCLVISGLPVTAGILNVTWWLSTRLPRPTASTAPNFNRRRLLASMMRVGLLYFLLQLAATLNFGIDPLVVNQVLGSAAVSTLAVVQKPFDLLSIILLLLLQPLWPAYREAFSSGDIPWVRATFRRAFAVSLALAIAFALIMAISGRELIRLWSGPEVNPSEALIVAYCAAQLFSASQTPLAYFFNGLGKIRFQLILGIPALALSILLKVLLTPRFGLAIIPWTTVSVGVIVLLPAQIYYTRYLFRRLLRISPSAAQASPSHYAG